jgi:hypothetical protein
MIGDTFVDRSGKVFCQLPSTDGFPGIMVPLRDRTVKSSLFFRYHSKHKCHPSISRVNAAIDYVEGRQVTKMRSDTTISECPTWKCFRSLLEEEPSGTASADDLLKRLRKINSDHKLLKGKEILPRSATVMGLWLTRHQLTIRPFGVDLSRPTRRAKKRLWAWQTIEPDDASDTSLLHASVREKHQNTERDKPNDTMSGTELNHLLEGILDDTN